jgi:squalene cyclase
VISWTRESDADNLTPWVTLETPEPENPELVRAAKRAIEFIRSTQKPDGCWGAPIESDASVTAHHVLLMHCLRRVDPGLQQEMVRFIRAAQNPEGGWSAYPGGPSALDETVICYAALKASGISADDPALVRARSLVNRLGGLRCTGLTVRAVLVFLGQIPLKVIPYVSPKVVNLPKWFRPSIYDLSLARLIVVPVALLRKLKALRPLPPERGIAELIMGQINWDIRPETLGEANKPITSLKPWRQGTRGVVGRLAAWLRKGTEALRRESTWKMLRIVSAISQTIDACSQIHGLT